MESVFSDAAELKRLAVQRALLREYEQPVYQKITKGRSGLTLLDVGCNDGSKTADRFSTEVYRKVVGVDCLEELIVQAEEKFGNEVFSFYFCDVMGMGLKEKLEQIMQREGIVAFDVINCSFLLMHLENPLAVLEVLREFLAEDGCLVVIEPDDSESVMTPDKEGLFEHFLRVLASDPYAGKRNFGKELPSLLEKSGYTGVTLEVSAISAGKGEERKKERIFQTFCSYLPEDLALLRMQSPDLPVCQEGWKWVKDRLEELHRQMINGETEISMGIKIYTCGGK